MVVTVGLRTGARDIPGLDAAVSQSSAHSAAKANDGTSLDRLWPPGLFKIEQRQV